MAEQAAREGNMKQLYVTTKKLAGKYSKSERPVKDKEGRLISETQQQRNRWVEFSEELVNRPAPMNPPDIEAAHTDLPPLDVNPPTTEQIRMAIKQIKSGKAAGPDNIPAEAPLCRRKGEDWQSKDRIPTIEQHVELKATFNQYQSQNVQYERQDSSTVRKCNLENYNNHRQEGTNLQSTTFIRDISDMPFQLSFTCSEHTKSNTKQSIIEKQFHASQKCKDIEYCSLISIISKSKPYFVGPIQSTLSVTLKQPTIQLCTSLKLNTLLIKIAGISNTNNVSQQHNIQTD
ncbi:unnamed protein product [Schistosoma margrebowiei]|uniref:Uncharacterized protein n=1 Tax=Schistosoma margrebowiei TaxID=48269 RepID=A0A183NAJ5_9TREM|nr:unnamed protein product [Schistosoma margrebowiei]